MFGFRYEDIDYTQDVDADIEIEWSCNVIKNYSLNK